MHSKGNKRPAFRIVRGASGFWEVIEEGIRDALALFRAPQAALSYACDLAAKHKGTVVMIFSRAPTERRRSLGRLGPGSASLQ